MLLAKIQVRWKYLENKMGPRQPPQLQDVPSRKWVFAAQPVGLGRLLRTEALLPAQSRVPQSLQRPRGFRPAFLLARAFAQPVGLDRFLRTETLLLARSRVSNPLKFLLRLNWLSPEWPSESPTVPGYLL